MASYQKEYSAETAPPRVFSLRFLIIAVAIVGVLAGLIGRYFVHRARTSEQTRELRAIVTRGGYLVWDRDGVLSEVGFKVEIRRTLTDRDIVEFPVAHLQTISKLDLSESMITDKSLEILRQLKALRELDLRGTAVSKQGKQELEVTLPSCDVKL